MPVEGSGAGLQAGRRPERSNGNRNAWSRDKTGTGVPQNVPLLGGKKEQDIMMGPWSLVPLIVPLNPWTEALRMQQRTHSWHLVP